MTKRERDYIKEKRIKKSFKKMGVGYSRHKINKSVFETKKKKGVTFFIPNFFIDNNGNPLPRKDGKPPRVNVFFRETPDSAFDGERKFPVDDEYGQWQQSKK